MAVAVLRAQPWSWLALLLPSDYEWAVTASLMDAPRLHLCKLQFLAVMDCPFHQK